MKKFLAAFLMVGLLVSAGATVASAAGAANQHQYNSYSYPGGNG